MHGFPKPNASHGTSHTAHALLAILTAAASGLEPHGIAWRLPILRGESPRSPPGRQYIAQTAHGACPHAIAWHDARGQRLSVRLRRASRRGLFHARTSGSPDLFWVRFRNFGLWSRQTHLLKPSVRNFGFMNSQKRPPSGWVEVTEEGDNPCASSSRHEGRQSHDSRHIQL